MQNGGNRCYSVTECSAFLRVSCNIQSVLQKNPTYWDHYIMTISLTCIIAHLINIQAAGQSNWQIKWTECKKWKRNSEKFNFLLNLFLLFRINYSRNWECFDQSCVNQTEIVHGTLRFLYLSHLFYGICVKMFIMNHYISKSYSNATSKDNIDWQYTERGQL